VFAALPATAGEFTALASYYGGGGRERLNARTASGERFNASAMICAHRSLPFGTRLLVSRGGRSVIVRVSDRGPALKTGRGLDLSRGAASRLGMLGAGVARVHVAIIN
jgi:rare lipoprotein A